MPPILIVLIILGSILGVSAGLQLTSAEDGTPAAGHAHDGHAAASPDSGSPYADRYDPDAAILSLTPEEIARSSAEKGPASHCRLN
jgi:hypothetical protein